MLTGTWATIDGIAAPLYYVSDGQMNIQIPYEKCHFQLDRHLMVDNNGQTASFSFPIAAAAPAIFTTNSQGTGQGAILNTANQLVDASHPATSGQVTYIPDLLHGENWAHGNESAGRRRRGAFQFAGSNQRHSTGDHWRCRGERDFLRIVAGIRRLISSECSGAGRRASR